MDGKLLVLCGERPTINDERQRIDGNGHLLREKEGKFYNINDEEVYVDTHKDIISGMQLLNPMVIPATETDMLFVDWETVITTDIELLAKMKMLARSPEKLTPQEILEIGKGKSLIEKAYMERLLLIDRFGGRPSIDYQFQAMDDFMSLFSEAAENKGVVTVLPAFPESDSEEVNRARRKWIDSWNFTQDTKAKIRGKEPIELANSIVYSNFGQLRETAQEELFKIYDKPYFFEKRNLSQDDEEPGGRD